MELVPLHQELFYEAECKSALEISEVNLQEMLEKLSEVNEENHYYKTWLVFNDMQFCTDFTLLLKK